MKQSTARAPRADNRRQALLDAAAGLWARQGFHAVSIRDISAAIGMLPGSVYYHFPSKRDLLLAVYEEAVRRIAARVDRAVEGFSAPGARLEAAAVAHLEAILDAGDYARVVVRVLPDDLEEAAGDLIALRDGYEERFRRLIDALDLPPGTDRGMLRLVLLGALNGAQTWFRGGRLTPREAARRILQQLRMQGP